jgi:hypothetical protein
VISITPDADLREATSFAKEVKATFPVIQDPKTAIFEKFGTQALPRNVIIDRAGKVVADIEGADTRAMDAAVAKAVGK